MLRVPEVFKCLSSTWVFPRLSSSGVMLHSQPYQLLYTVYLKAIDTAVASYHEISKNASSKTAKSDTISNCILRGFERLFKCDDAHIFLDTVIN